ncbi:MAG TPA: PDZ domain-containing protein [Rhodanobacteraceae bacterium]|jgi:S1-C subfamily serine protease|nr:PDZ domain-containing protein [Rhodanobacteraceae bacterium]
MKRIFLIAGTAFAVHGAALQGASAADAPAATHPAPVVAPAASSDAAQTAKAEEARKQLAELRTQMQELSRKMADLSSQLGEGNPRSYAMRYLGNPDHALIGVVLGRDDKGVRLSAVTPDGPAARAGLREGDLLTTIDQQTLAAAKPGESLEKARTLLGNLKEGQDISIDFLRGTQKGTVKFAAERREAWNWPLMMNEDSEHPFLPKDFNERIHAQVELATREAERVAQHDTKQMQAEVERATHEAIKNMPRDHQLRIAMPWWGLNLAPLNADLGRYFGTDKGVLVIAADQESLPGIRAGDVITSIAGETVDRPEDALRALRDKASGKDVPIKVLRDRKTLAFNMKAPTFNSIFDMRAAPPAPPTPPSVPAPPAPASLPAPPAPPSPAASPVAAPVASPPTPPTPPAEHVAF